MSEAFICDYVRTPIERFGGSLSSVRADVGSGYFYNDSQSIGSGSAQILADLLFLGRLCNSYGSRFHWRTPIPSTDDPAATYLTLAAQTVNTTYAARAAAVKAGMAAFFAAGYANGGITGGMIDYDSTLRDSVETDKWAANFAAAADKVHPSPGGHAIMGAVVNAYVAALSVP